MSRHSLLHKRRHALHQSVFFLKFVKYFKGEDEELLLSGGIELEYIKKSQRKGRKRESILLHYGDCLNALAQHFGI